MGLPVFRVCQCQIKKLFVTDFGVTRGMVRIPETFWTTTHHQDIAMETTLNDTRVQKFKFKPNNSYITEKLILN